MLPDNFIVGMPSGKVSSTTSDMDPNERWQERAACFGENPELFFPEVQDATTTRKAKSICSKCPVTGECSAYARKNRLQGVWGGRSYSPRIKMQLDITVLPVYDSDPSSEYPITESENTMSVVNDGRTFAPVEAEGARLLSVSEAAERIGVSTQVVSRWIKQGLLVPIKRIGKVAIFDEATVDSFERPSRVYAPGRTKRDVPVTKVGYGFATTLVEQLRAVAKEEGVSVRQYVEDVLEAHLSTFTAPNV